MIPTEERDQGAHMRARGRRGSRGRREVVVVTAQMQRMPLIYDTGIFFRSNFTTVAIILYSGW